MLYGIASIVYKRNNNVRSPVAQGLNILLIDVIYIVFSSI